MGGLGQGGWKEVPNKPGGFVPMEELEGKEPTPEEVASVMEKIEKNLPLTEAEKIIAEHQGVDLEAESESDTN